MIGRNNPLNIRYSPSNHWKGQSGYTRGFCNFRSLNFGIRAVIKILLNYRKRGKLSYQDIIYTWAPEIENNSHKYLLYVCDKCQVFSWDVPNDIESFATLIYYMWSYEQGKSPSLSIADIESIINDLNF